MSFQIEKNLANYTFYRGRVALYAVLRALEIGKGDEVVLQAFTCVANPEAIMASGATPIYVDVEHDGVNMDPEDLEQKITSRTRAIIIQHTFGISADLDLLVAVASKNKIPIIEDCCHTLMSQYNGKTVGTFGVGSYYSFEWGKPLVAGIGGALIVNDPLLAKKVKEQYAEYRNPPASLDVRLRVQYMAHKLLYRPRLFWPVRSLFHFLGKLGAAESNYNPIVEGRIADDFSLLMSRFAQGRLKKKILLLKSITDHSTHISSQYSSLIHAPSVKHVTIPEKSSPAYCRYPLLAENKEVLLGKARKANIEIAEWYATPVHPLKGKELVLVNYTEGACPNAEERCDQIVTLPVHTKVGRYDIERTLKFFNEYTYTRGDTH